MSLPQPRLLRTVGVLVVSVAVAVGAGVTAIASSSAADDDEAEAQRSRASALHVQVVDASHTLARSLHREAIAVMVDGLDASADITVDAATEARLAALDTLERLLRSTAEEQRRPDDRAPRALRELDDLPLSDDDLPLADLAFLSFPVLDAAGTARPERGRAPHLIELATIASLPTLIADEALIAQIATDGLDVSDEVAEYVEAAWQFVREDGGWLGPSGSVTDRESFFETRASRDRAPEAIERIDTVLASSDIARVDAWLRSLPAQVSSSPISPAGTVTALDAAEAEIGAIVSEVFSDEINRFVESAQTAEADARRSSRLAYVLFAVAAVAFAVAATIVAVAAWRALQRGKLATVDQLTGLGNRHVLDDATAVLLADRRYAAHAVAIIDCDRFKMINDLHGHEVGDLILVEIARRLESAAASLQRRADARTTIVRLGGDEFLLSVHSRTSVDTELVRAVLSHERRHPLLLDDGLTIPVDFSIGVVATTDAADLMDLMHQADLAVYEEKAKRRPLLGELPEPLPLTNSGS